MTPWHFLQRTVAFRQPDTPSGYRPPAILRPDGRVRATGAASNVSAPLERERDLHTIGDVLAEAVAGHGRLLIVEGPAGIGKSRLLEEATGMAGAAGMDVLSARAGELERDYPFGVVVDLLLPHLMRLDKSERAHMLRGRASLAAPLLSREGNGLAAASPTDEFALVHGLYWHVVNLAEESPLALIVDDVHWADELSLRFLIYLAQRLEDLPVALLVAVRTGDPHAGSDLVARLAGGPTARQIVPRELSLAATRDLLEAAGLPTAEREELVRASWEATGGNPFLLSEVAAAMKEQPDTWATAQPAIMGAFAPDSVGRSVVLRLANLGDDARALAQACSVLGDRAPLGRAAALAGLDPPAGRVAAERLVAARLLATADPASFVHPMIRSAVYNELPPGEQPLMHAAAAQLLHEEDAASDQIAQHLLLGTPVLEPWARDALQRGARDATRKGAPGTAVRYLRKLLELWRTQEQPSVLVDLGLAEAASGETTSLTRFEEALATIDAPGEQAHALYALGQTLLQYGRHDEAAATFQRGIRLLRADPELAAAFEGAYLSTCMYVYPRLPAAAARLDELAARIDARAPLTPSARVILAARAHHRSRAVPDATATIASIRAALGEDLALLREHGPQHQVVNLSIYALLWCGCNAEAERLADASLVAAREQGSALAFAETSLARALVMQARGRIDEARADLQTAIDGMERGWQTGVPAPQGILAECLLDAGEADEAAATIEPFEELLARPETSGLNTYLYLARGRLRLRRSEPAEALEDFLMVGRLLEPAGLVNPAVAPWRSLAGFAAHFTGDDALALRLIDEEAELARSFSLPAQRGAALRVRAIAGPEDEAQATLEQAIALLEGADAPLALARALIDLGSRRRRAGQRVESREPLRRARELSHRAGASALEQRALDELHASGARPRRVATSGAAALTPSERRIAELAAAGHTNRGIAETLFITKNTVEWHLHHVYRKLGVSSRSELADGLANDRPEG